MDGMNGWKMDGMDGMDERWMNGWRWMDGWNGWNG